MSSGLCARSSTVSQLQHNSCTYIEWPQHQLHGCFSGGQLSGAREPSDPEYTARVGRAYRRRHEGANRKAARFARKMRHNSE